MKKKFLIGIVGMFTMGFIFYSCKREDSVHVSTILTIDVSSSIKEEETVFPMVDSLLKNDTSIYMTWTMTCEQDSIFQFKHRITCAPNQPLKAMFIPCSSFKDYCSLIRDTFMIPQINLTWENLGDTTTIEFPLVNHYTVYMAIWSGITKNGVSKRLKVNKSIEGPQKVYYHYDWESKMHYDYMRYNADSAVLTFTITNLSTVDSISPIDSVMIDMSSGRIAGFDQLPLQIKDTISIVEDTTYNCTVKGYMKGQFCGGDTYRIRVHKNEIVEEQDESYRYQGQIYEYE